MMTPGGLEAPGLNIVLFCRCEVRVAEDEVSIADMDRIIDGD